MTKWLDLAGKQFGQLTAVSRGTNNPKSSGAQWYCKCDCGEINVLVSTHSLVSENTKSCGCSKRKSKYRQELVPRNFDIKITTIEQENAKQVFIGSMLGDGHVTKRGRFIEAHAVAQQGLCELLYNQFLVADWHPMIMPWKKAKPPRQAQVATILPSCNFMREQATQWYIEAKNKGEEKVKILPNWLTSEHMTALTIATWFAGDGSGRKPSDKMRGQLYFATNNFSLLEIKILANLLYLAHGIRAQPQIAYKSKKGRIMYVLATSSVVESNKILKLIDGLLPECVQYKLDGIRYAVSISKKI